MNGGNKMAETITVVILAVIAFGAGAFGIWYINRGEEEENQNEEK